VLFTLNRPRDLEMPVPMPAPSAPVVAAPSGVPRAGSGPAVLLELAPPIDHGTEVELHWTSNVPDLEYAVNIAADDGTTRPQYVGTVTEFRVPVDSRRRYCFSITGGNADGPTESAPKAIRGATCRQ